jgi:hypothetical protein
LDRKEEDVSAYFTVVSSGFSDYSLLCIFHLAPGSYSSIYHLARTGSEHPFIGPEPACGISIGVAKKAVRDWMNRNQNKHWESVTGLRQAKGIIHTRALCQKNEGSV